MMKEQSLKEEVNHSGDELLLNEDGKIRKRPTGT